jgi:hypothetical protein
MKSKIAKILLCVSIGAVPIIVLTLMQYYKANIANNFTRSFPPHKYLGKRSVFTKKAKYSYLAGSDDHNIYVGFANNPSELLRIDQKYIVTSIHIYGERGLTISPATRLIVDTEGLTLVDGIQRKIWLSHPNNPFRLLKKIETPYFTDYVKITNSISVLRSVINKANQIVKFDYLPNHTKLTTTDKLLQKQVDGLFCTDGALVKVPKTSNFIYFYYYRNQFIYADSALKVIYRGKTIDTVSKAQLRVATNKQTRQITLASSPQLVNVKASASENHLFIYSAMKADNETEKMHKNGAAIDIYSTKNGSYKFSIRIPNIEGERMREFMVRDKMLVALFDSYVYFFDLKF